MPRKPRTTVPFLVMGTHISSSYSRPPHCTPPTRAVMAQSSLLGLKQEPSAACHCTSQPWNKAGAKAVPYGRGVLPLGSRLKGLRVGQSKGRGGGKEHAKRVSPGQRVIGDTAGP